jgi:hypothetical protein
MYASRLNFSRNPCDLPQRSGLIDPKQDLTYRLLSLTEGSAAGARKACVPYIEGPSRRPAPNMDAHDHFCRPKP